MEAHIVSSSYFKTLHLGVGSNCFWGVGVKAPWIP